MTTEAEWLAYLDTLPEPDIEPPVGEHLPEVLVDLAVPHEDIPEVLAHLPAVLNSPELWRMVSRAAGSLVRHMGTIESPPRFPAALPSLGDTSRFLYVYAFVAALPYVREYHRSLGIPAEVSRLTLADLGRNVAVHKWRHGEAGLVEHASWIMLHFRGVIYQLGRLQFERAPLGTRTSASMAAHGLPYRPGDPTLSVHIPDFYGPLSPAACDRSFALAREFFPRYFPAEEYRTAVCHSWLLDEQLAEYLPADSNIVRFLRRFTPSHRTENRDEVIQQFVFGRVAAPDEHPYRTALERAVVDHLKAGRHWHSGSAWLLL